MVKSSSTPMILNILVDRLDEDSVEIRWETSYPDLMVSIYLSESPKSFNDRRPAIRVKGKTLARISGLQSDIRYYFKVVPENRPGIIVGERRISLDGAMNFRDLGGYKTVDGRYVKWGQIFRSDNLSQLTDRDHRMLNQMNIGQVFDFRSPKEVETFPDRLPEDGSIAYFHLPIMDNNIDTPTTMMRMKEGDISWLTDDFMVKRYLHNLNNFPDTWGVVFKQLSCPEGRSIVFHCSAGKDRAGVCAALILLCLGVPEETILYDHDLSNRFLTDWLEHIRKHVASSGLDTKKIEPYICASREGMEAVLNHIRETYHSVANYLCAKAEIERETIALLRKKLLTRMPYA